MTDLRALPIETRRDLAAEAKRRAEAGERPTETAAALGLSLTTYRRWAALYGFRLSDLDPNHVQARGQLPAGPGSYGASGRFMLGQGLGGRVKGSGRPPGIDLQKSGLDTAPKVLDAVRAALAEGDQGRVDRLMAAWKLRLRRARDLAALETAAAWEEARNGPANPLSAGELAEFLSDLTGRAVRVDA